jgi:hypothetical protein
MEAIHFVRIHICLYFLRLSSDLDKFRYGRFLEIIVKVIPSFMKIDALNAMFGLGERRNFYRSAPYLFSNLGAIRYYSSAHSDAEQLSASREPTQVMSVLALCV